MVCISIFNDVRLWPRDKKKRKRVCLFVFGIFFNPEDLDKGQVRG